MVQPILIWTSHWRQQRGAASGRAAAEIASSCCVVDGSASIWLLPWSIIQSFILLHCADICPLQQFYFLTQAIFNLDKPWAATEKAQDLKGVLGREAGMEMRRPEQLLRDFRMGEERVRHIVLGSPLAPQLANTPPAWVR